MDKKIMKLATDTMRELNLTEISIKDGDTEIFMRRDVAAANEGSVADKQPNTSAVYDRTEYFDEIRSPMIGIYHSSREPGEMPFVHEGKSVSRGDVLCVIEAMKMISEVKCEYNGVVENVYVTDGCLVEYGQPLFRILKTL